MYLTVKDLAPQLQVKPSTLYAWAAQGKIPFVKIHGLLRFRRDEIEPWLESFRATPPAQRVTRRPRRKTVPDLDPLIARVKRVVYTADCGKPDQDRAMKGGD